MWPEGNPGSPPTGPFRQKASQPVAAAGRAKGGIVPNRGFSPDTMTLATIRPPNNHIHQMSPLYAYMNTQVISVPVKVSETMFAIRGIS